MFCIQCGNNIIGEAHFCAACGAKVDGDPSAPVNVQIAEAINTNVAEPVSARTLIDCAACSRSISKRADKCPTCGAPNKWIDPRIKQFLLAKDNTGIARPFTFKYSKTEVWGETKVQNPWWVWLIAICLLPIYIGGGFFLGVISAAIGWWILTLVFGRKHAFHATVENGVWKSDDDGFWRPVRTVLDL